MLMWIMIAGRYRGGAKTPEEWDANLRALNEAALAIFDKGHVPVIGVNMALPVIAAAGEARYREIMMPLSLALAERCDGILRLPGDSPGADEEVDIVRNNGGVVFTSLEDVPPA